MDAGRILFSHVAKYHPDVYRHILDMVRPYSLKSIVCLFQDHLEHSVPDLNVFNTHLERIPVFCFEFVRAIRKNFPQPGDAYGIQLTCRMTRSDTQGTLDSKHLRSSYHDGITSLNVDKAIRYELDLFSTQSQVFELAVRHQYATVYVEGYGLRDLMERLPRSCYLERGEEYNKARDVNGERGYINTFTFVIVADKRNRFKILYQSARDLLELLKRLDMRSVVAFSDVRYLFKKCGIVCHYFNMVHLLHRQLFNQDDSVYEKDVLTVCKYQCHSGRPLPLTREGLAKNRERSPIEVLSFEAPKKNYARLCTGPERLKRYEVETSADKIFFGQQFNEGTGSNFAVIPQEICSKKRKIN